MLKLIIAVAAAVSSPSPQMANIGNVCKSRPYTIFFKPGTDTVTPEAKTVLKTIVEAENNCKENIVSIRGHTSRGDKVFNVGLSQRRASNVASFLYISGIDHSRLLTEAFGESRLLVPAGNKRLRWKNDRVEIEFVDPPRW